MSQISTTLECPECGNRNFLEGPHGGAAVNIKCAKCGHWMNATCLPDGRWWILNESRKEVMAQLKREENSPLNEGSKY